MKYILVLIVFNLGSGKIASVETREFSSKETCETARTIMLEMVRRDKGKMISAECVPADKAPPFQMPVQPLKGKVRV